MASDRFRELIQRLLHATENGELIWQRTAKEGVFRIALGEGLVRIEGDEPYDNGHFYAAYLVDRKGQIIDQIRAEADVVDSYLMLDKLYKAASLSADNRENAVIDSMLKDLEEGRTRRIPSGN